MNVIVSNKYQNLLNSLNIDIIKSINGVFTVEELKMQFANFYFNKMIIDITAIQDYENINVIQLLSVNFDMDKIILLLDDSPKVNSPMYLSQLVSMGVYNFTRSVDAIPFLITNPNSYKDVAQYHNLSGFKAPKLNETSVDYSKGQISKRVIGFRNITSHAGSTTLVYLAKMYLEKVYKVKAVEVDGNDFQYFNDPNLDRTDSTSLDKYLNDHGEYDIVLVDLNTNCDNLCDDVIYLIEPGILKLNKLISENKHIFKELENKKIVLNKSLLTDKDISDFEEESGSKVFYNLPPVDDNLDNQGIFNAFLSALGFSRINGQTDDGMFNVFN